MLFRVQEEEHARRQDIVQSKDGQVFDPRARVDDEEDDETDDGETE